MFFFITVRQNTAISVGTLLTFVWTPFTASGKQRKKKIAKRKTKVFQKVFYLPSFRTVFNFPQCKLVVYASREEMSDATCAAPSHAPRATSSELALIKRASICFLSCRRTSKKCFKFNDTQEEGEEVLYWRDRVDCNFKDRNNWSWHTFCQLSITRWRIEEKD